VRKVTHARKRNPCGDRDEILHMCRGPRRNHLCQLLWLSLMGFERGGGSKFGFLHLLELSPLLQRPRTTVRVCDLHVILHQATEFRPNRSTHYGNMTSYPFFKMAATTTKYYFRFRICWCCCLRTVKVYQETKLCENISIDGWDITTSAFEKQTSAVLQSYHFAIICMLFCIRLPNFVQMGALVTEIWRHIHFSRWRTRPLNTSSGFIFLNVAAFRWWSLSANQISSTYLN